MKLGQPLPVLMYHHISPKPGLVTCSPENFRAQMEWLAKNGWKTLSTATFATALASGQLPKKSVLITFDDGYLDNWIYAHPVLQEFGLQATIFLITGWIGDGEKTAPRWTVRGSRCAEPQAGDDGSRRRQVRRHLHALVRNRSHAQRRHC